MGTEVFALVTILRATGTELFRRRTVAPFWGGKTSSLDRCECLAGLCLDALCADGLFDFGSQPNVSQSLRLCLRAHSCGTPHVGWSPRAITLVSF